MTLADLLADCYRRLGLEETPDPKVAKRITAFLNETQQAILSEPGFGRLASLVTPTTFASVAAKATYTLPPSVVRVLAVTERDTDRMLTSRDLQWYRSVLPDPTATTGTPDIWIPLSTVHVVNQPSDASQIFVKSSSASDTQLCYVEGIRSGKDTEKHFTE